MVNLLVDLRDERFAQPAAQTYLQTIERAGFSYVHAERAGDSALAWIDEEFGGTWSSETFAGKSVFATEGNAFAGFAAYEPQGLRFSWLREWHRRPEVGIFGPFGVAPKYRGTPLGEQLLLSALASLSRLGYQSALIPAVGGERLAAYYMKRTGAKVVEEFERSAIVGTPVRATVLASGNGSNFQAVLDAAQSGRLPLDVRALVTNREDAFALQRARECDVADRAVVAWDRKNESRDAYDERLLRAVQKTEPALVLLLGWMHLLSERFVAAFPQMINIHPAYLPLDQARDVVGMPDGSVIPAFRGAHAIQDALKAGSPWIGASCHRVTLDTDRGPVLVRKPMQLAGEGEGDADTVLARLRPIEHAVLTGGIMRWVFERS